MKGKDVEDGTKVRVKLLYVVAIGPGGRFYLLKDDLTKASFVRSEFTSTQLILVQ